MKSDRTPESPVEFHESLSDALGVELLVKRDDLLPFPLAGNKVRKIEAELASLIRLPEVVITNGGIDSNHCRTLAFMGARRGFRVHLVLHGLQGSASAALSLLHSLGARYEIVEPHDIAPTIERLSAQYSHAGIAPHVIPGGAHTPAGAIAYRDTSSQTVAEAHPDVVIFASGTGATHGGIAAGAASVEPDPRVIGVSVARSADRGFPAVREAACWAGLPPDRELEFRDEFRDGGYGLASDATLSAVSLGWSHGLPLDPTYTGKAFAALFALTRSGEIAPGSRVLFWHTGGLWNAIAPIFTAMYGRTQSQ